MQILYELRYPSRWYTKLLMALLALAFFAVLATTAIAGFLVYRIVKPQRTSSEINMASFPGRPETISFNVPGLGSREGWFFPGLRGAPTILLCHGYESSRGELLTLVSALQDHQYNAFVFDFAGHGGNPGPTNYAPPLTLSLRGAIWTLNGSVFGATTSAPTPRCVLRKMTSAYARWFWIRSTTNRVRW
jgi:predicted alpha/beta-fold hydrolase